MPFVPLYLTLFLNCTIERSLYSGEEIHRWRLRVGNGARVELRCALIFGINEKCGNDETPVPITNLLRNILVKFSLGYRLFRLCIGYL